MKKIVAYLEKYLEQREQCEKKQHVEHLSPMSNMSSFFYNQQKA